MQQILQWIKSVEINKALAKRENNTLKVILIWKKKENT